ncbi:MAG: pyridoxamine 5'-phosphate oxidase family protein [Gammaproteobacteria bacterium]
MKTFAAIAFTPAVRALQEAYGSRAAYARMDDVPPEVGLGAPEAALLHGADSFYVASVNADGWPYVQHRGGPRGFVRVLSPERIAFADFRGNRQFISAGNVSTDDRVALIVMDYPQRRRLKLFGHLRMTPVDTAPAELVEAVRLPDYRARIERVATVDIAAFDWNCPQHITPRFTVEEIDARERPLRARLAELEAELAALHARRT